MKKNISLFIVFLFLSQMVGAQVAVVKLSYVHHFKQLKNGILLVQLPNKDKKIAKLKEYGQVKKARLEQESIDLERESIIEGFKTRFKFCRFFFFEREHTQEILQEKYQHVFDAEYKNIENFPETENVYVAQYGVASPKSENYRYNGVGFQIKYVNNGELEILEHDYFYKRSKAGILIGKKRAIVKGIKNLNYKLNKIPVD